MGGERVYFRVWTDCYPATVVWVSPSGHQVRVREDRATVVDPDIQPGGFAPVHGPRQKWECHEDPEGELHTFTLRKSGQWKRAGTRTREAGYVLRSGWHYYRDPNF